MPVVGVRVREVLGSRPRARGRERAPSGSERRPRAPDLRSSATCRGTPPSWHLAKPATLEDQEEAGGAREPRLPRRGKAGERIAGSPSDGDCPRRSAPLTSTRLPSASSCPRTLVPRATTTLPRAAKSPSPGTYA